MGADKLVLKGGYEGADAHARKMADGAGTIGGHGKNARAAGEDLHGSQSGGFATQAANTALAGSEGIGSIAHDQATGAEGVARYVKQTAQAEEHVAGQQKQDVTNNLDVTQSVLHNSINK